LLVVIGIVGILAGLLLPVLATAKAKIQGATCLNNLRQLQMTMVLYAADNDDFVVWNWGYVKRSWVYAGDYGRGWKDFPGNTNVQWLINRDYAAYADYIQTPSIYKCPGDKTTVLINGHWQPWVRSYGASFFERKMTDFDSALSCADEPVPPALQHTFDEVHPGYLGVLYGILAGRDAFATFPAYRHAGGGTLSFADGHVELHRWVDPRTRCPLDENERFDATGSNVLTPSPGNVDLRWLSERSGVSGYAVQDQDVMRAQGVATSP